MVLLIVLFIMLKCLNDWMLKYLMPIMSLIICVLYNTILDFCIWGNLFIFAFKHSFICHCQLYNIILSWGFDTNPDRPCSVLEELRWCGRFSHICQPIKIILHGRTYLNSGGLIWQSTYNFTSWPLWRFSSHRSMNSLQLTNQVKTELKSFSAMTS